MSSAFQADAFQNDAFDIDQFVVVGLIDQTAQIHALTLSTTGTQNFDAPLIDQTAIAYAPQGVGNKFDLVFGQINQTAVLFDPTIARPITLIGSSESIRTTTVNPWNFTANTSPANTGSGNSYQTGHLLSVVMTGTGGNMVSGVTFKGYPMTEIVTAEDPTGEPGFASLWFISGIERGSGTAIVTLTSATTNDFQFVWMSFASQYLLEVIDFDSTSGDIDDPSVVLSTGGRESLAVATIFSGLDAVADVTDLGTMTPLQDNDFGTTVAKVSRQTTRGTTNFTAGFTTSAADDVALVAVLLAETNNQIVGFGLISQTATTFAPTLVYNQSVSLGLISQTATTFTPSFGRVVSVGLINRTAAAFDVHVNTFQIEAALISNPATAFAPSIEWDKLAFFDRIDRPALPFNPTISGGVTIPPDTSPATVIIRYDGQDITDDVVLVGANFTSQANGTPGTCEFRIKDPGHTYSLTVGKRLTLDINSERVWTGYVSKVSRVYAFPAMDTSEPASVTRFLRVEGVDINILFRKRVVFDKARPKNLMGRTYTADNTDDTVAYFDLVEDFLDLSGDNLDTSTLIENVGTINVDHPSNPIAPGHPWGDSMRSIIALSNGVFYIDPDRRVVLTDVDTPNAPFDLSDDPADSAVGYREMEVLYNASNMINDCIVWGAGAGSGTMVYSREEDATSIATHGRWQYGEFRGDMYKQGTVNRRADSIVQGSAQSKRGAKDDQVSVVCSVFQPGLRVAQKVDFTSAAFGFQDVLPIRRMTVSFIGPTQPKYQIMAGHEIDMPWGFFDIWRPRIGFDPYLPIMGDIPDIDIDVPCVDCDCVCNDAICGITDTFEGRTVVGEFGTSDAGIPWTTVAAGSGTTSFDVAFGKAFIYNVGSAAQTNTDAYLGTAVPPNEYTTTYDPTTVKTMHFQWDGVTPIYSTDYFIIRWDLFRSVGEPVPQIVYRGDLGGGSGGANGAWHIMTTGGLLDGTLIPDDFFVDDTTYTWTCYEESGTFYTSVTDGVDTYTASGVVTDTLMRCHVGFYSSLQSPFVAADRSWIILDIDIPEINSCSTYHFDTFTRTISNSNNWGTSDTGYAWTPFNFNRTTASVNGSKGQFVLGTSGSGSWTGYEEVIPSFLPNQWDLYAEFAITSITSTMLYFQFGVNSGNFWQHTIQISNSVGELEIEDQTGSLDTLAKTDWVANTIYQLHTFYDGTTGDLKMSVWPKEDPEPAWMLEVTGTDLEGPFDEGWFDVGIQSATSTLRTLSFDNINFVYDGAACNGHTETQTVLDDFERSIAVDNGSGLTNQWGDTSGTGDPWTNIFDPSSQGHLEYGVDNGEAIARFVMDQPFTQTKTMMMTLNEGGSDLSPFFTVGAGVPDELFGADDITWAIDFQSSTIDATRFPYIEIIWGDRVDRDIGWALTQLALSSGSLNGPYLRMDASESGLNEDQVTFTYAADTWYTLIVQRFGTIVRAKVFEVGTTEPSWMVSGPVTADLWEAGEFTVWGQMREINGSPTTEEFRFRDLRIVGSPCGQDVTTIPSSGRVCEDFVGDGSTDTFYTTQVQRYGMTSASIDGVKKYLQTEYFQTANAEGEIKGVIFNTPPADGAQIRICYTVGEGPLALGSV